MTLENKLGIENAVELAVAEEKIRYFRSKNYQQGKLTFE